MAVFTKHMETVLLLMNLAINTLAKKAYLKDLLGETEYNRIFSK